MGLFSGLVGIGLGLLGYKEQKDAARSARHTAEQATAQIRSDLGPYREAGEWAVDNLQDVIKKYERTIYSPLSYEQSPAFESLVGRQMNILGKLHSARGAIDSGTYDENVGQMINYLTLQDYGNYLNRLGSLANLYGGVALQGQSAAAQTGTAGIWGANALANAGYNQANAYTNLLQNLGGTLNQEYMLNALANRGALGTTGSTYKWL